MEKFEIKATNLEDVSCELESTVRRHSNEKLNCVENVFLTVYKFAEPKPDFRREAVGIVSGFGGGIPGYRSLCGAVSGGVGVLGIFFGRRDPLRGDQEERDRTKKEMYQRIRTLPENFEKEFGSLICRELIKEFLESNKMDDPIRKGLCLSFIAFSSKLCLNLLTEEIRTGM